MTIHNVEMCRSVARLGEVDAKMTTVTCLMVLLAFGWPNDGERETDCRESKDGGSRRNERVVGNVLRLY